MTDEQLVILFDAAYDRKLEAYYQSVEKVRLGVLYANHPKEYGKFQRGRPARRKSRSLSGEALESAVMNIARMFPDNVEQVTA